MPGKQAGKTKPKKEKKKVRSEVAKALKGKAGDFIINQSGYFKTIVDPFNFRGRKIPDLCTYPSCAFSVTDRRIITVNANGSCYVIYGLAGTTGSPPWGSLVPVNRATALHAYVVGQTSNAGASVPYDPNIDLFPSGGTFGNNLPFQFQQWNNSVNPTVQQLYQKVRLVSAGVSIDYTGTDFDNAGTITTAFAPRNSIIKFNMNRSVQTPVTFIQNLPDAIIVPVNKNKGSTVVYRPQDFESLNYTDALIGYDDSLADVALQALGGEMYHVVTGATPNKTFQVTSVFNYEGIPLFNTIDVVQPSPSKSDPLELSATFNRLQDVTPVSMGTEEAMGSGHAINKMAPGSNKIEHNLEPVSAAQEEPLMERIISAVSTGGKIAMDVGKTLTPLLSMLL